MFLCRGHDGDGCALDVGSGYDGEADCGEGGSSKNFRDYNEEDEMLRFLNTRSMVYVIVICTCTVLAVGRYVKPISTCTRIVSRSVCTIVFTFVISVDQTFIVICKHKPETSALSDEIQSLLQDSSMFS